MAKQQLSFDDLVNNARQTWQADLTNTAPARANPVTQTFDDLVENARLAYHEPPRQHLTSADSLPALTAKSAFKGLTSIGDVPSLLARFGQGMVNAYGTGPQSPSTWHKMGLPDKEMQQQWGIKPYEPIDVAKHVPDSHQFRNWLGNKINVDLEPRPGGGGSRILSHGVELGAGFGGWGAASKIGKGGSLLNQFVKDAKLGGAIGTLGGAGAEAGLDPLGADIGAALGVSTAGAIGNLAKSAGSAAKNYLFHKFNNKFNTDNSVNNLAREVANDMYAKIGEQGVNDILADIKKYEEQAPNNPIPTNLTTGEVSPNPALVQMHRVLGDSPETLGQLSENDRITREIIDSLGAVDKPPTELGQRIRAPIDEKYNAAIKRRLEETDPLYKEIEALQESHPTNSTRDFLTTNLDVLGPDLKKQALKYLNSLTRDKVDPNVLREISHIRSQLASLDRQGLGPEVTADLRNKLTGELNVLLPQTSIRPIQIDNTIKEVGDRLNKAIAHKAKSEIWFYGKLKEHLENDLRTNPHGLIYREKFHERSRGINEMEQYDLMRAMVEGQTDLKKPKGYVVPPDELVDKILGADVTNIKQLVKHANENGTIDLVKGIYLDRLLKNTDSQKKLPTYAKASQFLKDPFTREKIDVIFNDRERKVLDQFLDLLQRRENLNRVGQADKNSNTFQKFKTAAQLDKAKGRIQNLLQKLLVKYTGAGEAGNIAIDAISNSVDSLNKGTKSAIMGEALRNPSVFRDIMTGTHSQPVVDKNLWDFFQLQQPLGSHFNPIPGLVGQSYLSNREK